MQKIIDIEDLGFDSGAHLLVKCALNEVAVGASIVVTGSSLGLESQIQAWCRNQGHEFEPLSSGGDLRRFLIRRGHLEAGRWRGAERTGHTDFQKPDAVLPEASSRWGLAARGATVEAGVPEMHFRLNAKSEIWSENLSELYQQAVAAQWNADQAIDWNQKTALPDVIEKAVVQVLTYMIENEVAALVVPARFLGQVHPHYLEVQALLSIQIADEARHIDIFTRRIRMSGHEPGLSTAGGQASLKTLLDESDFSTAEFLLSVLGEGTFVNLLNFMHEHAPDPVTKQICKLASRDESRHVVFGMSHLKYRLEKEPQFRTRLRRAVEERHEALSQTSGLNEEVFDSLALLAAGELTPAAIRNGFARVQRLMKEMADGRRTRLERLGFDTETAARVSSLHTRNFM